MVRIVVIAVLIGSGLLAEDASVAHATPARSVPEYQTGQAARLVLGQRSFTSREGRISATSLVYSGGNLFATEQVSAQQFRVHVFNVASLPLPRAEVSAAREDACPVCGFMPSLDVDEQAPPDSPAIAERDDARVVADIPNRRVLIWHSLSAAKAGASADLILSDRGGVNGLIQPVSVEYDGHHLFVGDAARHQVLVWRGLPSVDEQPADAVLGNPDESTGPDAIRTPAALASDGRDLFVADPASHRILVFSPGDVPLATDNVVNAASLLPDPLATGSLIDIEGSGLSDDPLSASDENLDPLPSKLGGVQVLLNGVPLPLLSVSPTEIRTQLPYSTDELSAASLYVRTQHADGQVTITNAVPLRTVAAAPGLFGFGGSEPRHGMILHASAAGSESSGTPVTADDPARPGEQLIVWATGLGALDSDVLPQAGVPYDGTGDTPLLHPVSASVDGQSVQVLSARLPPAAIGIYEIRVITPATVSQESVARLVISQDGNVSNTVTFPVKALSH